MTLCTIDSDFKKACSSLIACDWSQSRFYAGLFRIPAILAAVLAGLYFHDAASGVIAVSGAFSLGLVGTRKVGGTTLRAMLVTVIVMGLGACLGTITGGTPLVSMLVIGILSAVFALCVVRDEDLGWVSMQGVIALLVSTSFPGDLEYGLIRAALVIGGGLMQMALIFAEVKIIDLISKDLAAKTAPPPSAPIPKQVETPWAILQKHWAYPLRVLLTTVVAVELGKHMGIRNGYWLPMTMLIILKPDFYRTYSGGFQRVVGTFIGVLFSSLIAHLFQPSIAWLLGLISILSLGCFSWVKVNPVLFSACLTAYVVFLIAITGLPEANVTWARLELTAIGSSIAILSRMIGQRDAGPKN